MTQFSISPSSNENDNSSKPNHIDEHDESSRNAFKNSLNHTAKALNNGSDNQFHNQVNQLLSKAISSVTNQETEDMSFTKDFSNAPERDFRKDLMHRQQRSGNSTVQSREDAKRGPQQ